MRGTEFDGGLACVGKIGVLIPASPDTDTSPVSGRDGGLVDAKPRARMRPPGV